MKSFWLLSLCAFALGGCESGEGEGGEGEPAAAPAEGQPAAAPAEGAPAAAAPAAAEGPAAVCNKLIEAIKAKNAEGINGVSTDGTPEMMTPETVDMLAGEMGAATCGEEKIDGDKATVTVTSGDTTRDIPFAKVGDAWKFDSKAYAEKYPPAKGKGKKGKKEKGKKGKKGKK